MTSDERIRERYERLRAIAYESRRHISWLLPFLDPKAKQSGDVAGMQVNAKGHVDEITRLLNFYEAEDKAEAKALAK